MKAVLTTFIAYFVALLIGLLLTGIGLIIAIFAGADWLLLSLAGILLAFGAGYVLYKKASGIKRSFQSDARVHVRTKLK